MAALELRILSAEGTLLEDSADRITLTALDGSLGILPGHTPMIAALQAGPVRYRNQTGDHTMDIPGGIAEVARNQVTIIVG